MNIVKLTVHIFLVFEIECEGKLRCASALIDIETFCTFFMISRSVKDKSPSSTRA